MMPSCQIIVGDALKKLPELPPKSVQCCITSPPYFNQRDYGHPDQIGRENSVEEYIVKVVQLARGVRHVLRNDGTFWINLGDTYSSGGRKQYVSDSLRSDSFNQGLPPKGRITPGWAKQKDRLMIPARVAIALQSDGWYLRDEIVWHKPNPMVESTTDRCTKSHEFIYMLTKEPHYYYDQEAIKEPISEAYANDQRPHGVLRQRFYPGSKYVRSGMIEMENGEFPTQKRDTVRNKRSVWTVITLAYPGNHFATFPPDLIKPCILAGSRPGDTVLDPCAGRGTTGEVSLELGRNCVLIELSATYASLCRESIDITPSLPFFDPPEKSQPQEETLPLNL